MARMRLAAVVLSLVVLGIAFCPPAAARDYDFYRTQVRTAEPVRWNPCTPVTFKVNTGSVAPAAAVRRVFAAVAEASAATGIRFRYLGRTRFVPDSAARPVAPEVGADVVIAWAHPGSGPRRSALLPRVSRLAGVGGFAGSRAGGDFLVARSGYVVFNAGHVFRMSARKQYVVALHELGHLLGLGHVRDRRQVMYGVAVGNGPRHYAAGDRSGLARLGRRAGCLAPPSTPRRPEVSIASDRLLVQTPPVTSVSGAVRYTLYSSGFREPLGSSTAPRFAVPLLRLARQGFAGRSTTFTVTATNRVGVSRSPTLGYPVPAAVVTVPPTLAVTSSSLDVLPPRAVLRGTTVDVSDLLRISTPGTVIAYKTNGGTSPSLFYEHLLYFGSAMTRYEVSGSVLVEGPGLSRAFDMSGTYLVPEPVS